MSSTEQAIEVIKKQILERAKVKKKDMKLWEQDLANFCKMALAGNSYEECLQNIFKTPKEGNEYGFDRLYPIYTSLMNGEVAFAIYQNALYENCKPSQKLVAERRMGWAEHKKIEHAGGQDFFAQLLSSDETSGD